MSDLYDKRGVPIYPGDLLKSFHFQGARRKRYYLYHVAVDDNGRMKMIPACWLEPTKRSGGGDVYLSAEIASATEVIYGYGPKPCLDYTDRERRRS